VAAIESPLCKEEDVSYVPENTQNQRAASASDRVAASSESATALRSGPSLHSTSQVGCALHTFKPVLIGIYQIFLTIRVHSWQKKSFFLGALES